MAWSRGGVGAVAEVVFRCGLHGPCGLVVLARAVVPAGRPLVLVVIGLAVRVLVVVVSWCACRACGVLGAVMVVVRRLASCWWSARCRGLYVVVAGVEAEGVVAVVAPPRLVA